MDVAVVKAEEGHMVFNLSNADVSFANALRRIMLSDVETMAIEYVNIAENDSPMHDEVLAHRIGLLPINADPNDYEPCSGRQDLVSGKNCIELVLDFTAKSENLKPDGSVHVLSGHFKCVKPGQDAAMSGASSDDDEEDNMMLHQDIVVMKLAPGQRIKLRCFAVRGRGGNHIKWSPVSTAAYRATPLVTIDLPIQGKDAEALKKVCPKDVFDIEDGELVVARMGACSVCRECVRDDRGKDKIKLGRVDGSFDFSVEKASGVTSEEVVRRAVRILKEKCRVVRDSLQSS